DLDFESLPPFAHRHQSTARSALLLANRDDPPDPRVARGHQVDTMESQKLLARVAEHSARCIVAEEVPALPRCADERIAQHVDEQLKMRWRLERHVLPLVP